MCYEAKRRVEAFGCVGFMTLVMCATTVILCHLFVRALARKFVGCFHTCRKNFLQKVPPNSHGKLYVAGGGHFHSGSGVTYILMRGLRKRMQNKERSRNGQTARETLWTALFRSSFNRMMVGVSRSGRLISADTDSGFTASYIAEPSSYKTLLTRELFKR